jgi:hypothetical protein
LKKQTVKILQAAVIENELHRAECRVAKVPGSIYYHYERTDGTKILTIISPEEWNSKCPFKFLGAYKLEHDNTWIQCEPQSLCTQVDLDDSIKRIKDIF